jgi:hypothetical protein
MSPHSTHRRKRPSPVCRSHQTSQLSRPLAVAQAGVDPTLDGRALTVDHASWVVTLHSPEAQDFSGRSLEEGLAWCPVWLMVPELGSGPFRV